MASEVISANALRDPRTLYYVPDGRRRQRPCYRCPQSSGHKAAYLGLANGIAMTSGCEFHVRKWVKDPLWDLKQRSSEGLKW